MNALFRSLMLAGGLCGALALLSSGCAKDQGTGSSNAQQQTLTGSYVPQNAQAHGPVTTGPNNVRVINRSELDRSGAATPGQALQQLGATSP